MMARLKAIIFIGFIAFFCGFGTAYAQQTTVYTDHDANFLSGKELFQKQKYGAAQHLFQEVIKSHKDPQSLVRIDAEYYNALCAMELFHKDAQLLLKNFIKEHPGNPKVRKVYFYLGKYNYRERRYKDAIVWLNKVDIYDLNNDELSEFYFKRGYSYFQRHELDSAKQDFYEIKDVDTKYTPPANYYYAHIAYVQKNYQTALNSFMKLQDDDNFKSIVPYYIAQLYYLQGRYDKVISYAPPLLDSANTKMAPEIARIIGESYYNTSQYKEALPYLQKYRDAVGLLTRPGRYEMGYAYYKSGDIDKAIDFFQRTTYIKDTLAQDAYYQLAACYLKKDNKPFAKNAFESASKMNFDKKITEDALYNYAKLSYELSFSPFNEAIDAFRKYIKDYPNSPKVEQAYNYLVDVFMTTKDYQDALVSLNKITVLNARLKTAYQKVAYYYAVDLFNNSEMDSAIRYFDLALKYKFNKPIDALAYYWKGEAQYRLKRYKQAIDNYQVFMEQPGAFSMPQYDNAEYNIGYAFFEMKDYSSAILWFRKYAAAKPKDAKKLADASIRTGDSYFINRDFANSVIYYNQAIATKAYDIDYAMYQKALALGVQHKYGQKISTLDTLLTNYPKSNYTAPATFQLGKAYVLNNQGNKALKYYQRVVDRYPNSSFVNRSLLQIGLIYYNDHQDDKALNAFTELIHKSRKSPEANEALARVKMIYISKGNAQELEDYFKKVSATIPHASLDSIAFNIGRDHYLAGNCDQSVKDFAKYIQKYPDGIFINDANFYKGECDYKAGRDDSALTEFNFVIAQPRSEFTEEALASAAAINYDKNNYADALTDYQRLEKVAEYPRDIKAARVGQMRCNFQLKHYDSTIVYANKVMQTGKVSHELIAEAHLLIAKSDLQTEKYDSAMAVFNKTIALTNSEMAAEARYNVAYIQFLEGNFKASQKTIFDLVNEEPSYPYWMAKGLILLSDNYVSLNDNFQAKHTLQSVIDNSTYPDLIKLAKSKLQTIIQSEKQPLPKLLKEDISIPFVKDTLEYQRLFMDEPAPQKDGGNKQ